MAIHSHFSYKQQGTETDFEIELLRVAGKMAHWLRALALLPEDPGSIPSILAAAHNCQQLLFQGIKQPNTNIHADKLLMYISIKTLLSYEQ